MGRWSVGVAALDAGGLLCLPRPPRGQSPTGCTVEAFYLFDILLCLCFDGVRGTSMLTFGTEKGLWVAQPS